MRSFLKRGWAIGIIIAIWVLFSSPYFFKGLIPFASDHLVSFFTPWSATQGNPVKNNAMPDVITQIYPWKRLTIASWKLGQIPLWNPYSFGGTPHAGNYQSAVFTPLNLLFFVLPEIDAWSLMILLQPILAGLFMYTYLRCLEREKNAALFGAISYMFSGFIVVWMAYGTLVYAVLFLPLILTGIENYRNQGHLKWLAIVSMGVGSSFVSGHFQMSLYVLLFVLVYTLYRLRYATKIQLATTILFVVLGLIIALPQLYVSFLTYMGSGRSIGVSQGEIIPWQYLVTFFAPDFFGNPVTRNDWFGHYAEWAGFAGVVPLLLAVLTFFVKKKPRIAIFFGISFIVTLLFALPSPLNNLLYILKVPVLSNSAASRIIALSSFSLSVLGAFGFSLLGTLWKEKSSRPITVFFFTTVFSIAALWGALILLRPYPADKIAIAARNTLIPTVIFLCANFLVLAGFKLSKNFHVYLTSVLVMITIFDMLRFSTKWMPFETKSFVYPQVPVIEKLQSLTENEHPRIMGNIGNEVGTAFGLQLLEGYDAVYQRRYGEFVSSWANGSSHALDRSVVTFDKHGTYTQKIINLLGVKYYLHKKSDGRFPWAYPVWEYPFYNIVWEDDNFQIFENTNALPRAYLVDSYILAEQEADILKTLYDPSFEASKTLILEHEPELAPEHGTSTSSITTFSPNSITIQTYAESAKLLFISTPYDPAWKAKVDTKDASILRANYDFLSIPIPSGEHSITIRYEPSYMPMVILASIFATLYCAFVCIKRPQQHANRNV